MSMYRNRSKPDDVQVEDDSAEYFVAEHRAESTPQRRCCQPRRGIKGRNDFKTMALPASSRDIKKLQKTFVGQLIT